MSNTMIDLDNEALTSDLCDTFYGIADLVGMYDAAEMIGRIADHIRRDLYKYTPAGQTLALMIADSLSETRDDILAGSIARHDNAYARDLYMAPDIRR